MTDTPITLGQARWLDWVRGDCRVVIHAGGPRPAAGQGLELRVAWHTTPLGCLFIAVTRRGICRLLFRRPGMSHALLQRQLLRQWPGATLVTDAGGTARYLAPLLEKTPATEVDLDLRATAFQLRVWQALLEIPPGNTVTYGALAGRIGQPTASRAVGRAVAGNPVALLIPCHRVVPSGGGVGNYRWGVSRKRRLLAVESGALPARRKVTNA